MTGTGTAHLQRRLAEEFDHRGWEYDLGVGRTIVQEIERTRTVDTSRLAYKVSTVFLDRNHATREELSDAIARAVGGRTQLAEARGRQEPGMRLLFVAAGPADEPRLRLDAEHRDVTARIRASTARSQATVDAVLAARATDLIDALNRHRPTILHLAGHGGPTGIALEDDSGSAAVVTIEQLTRLVDLAGPTLRLVVLNTCDSAEQARPIISHVDAAIGMTASIDDETARTFSAQLYASLAESVPLGRAFEQARLQVDLAGLGDDQVPALFTRKGIDPMAVVFTA